MTTGYEKTREMLAWVASKLGADLLQEVVFVGGCTTTFLLTDEATQEDVRHTKDVDLIVDFMPDDPSILGHTNRWYGYALKYANWHEVTLGDQRFDIRIVSPLSFVATKLEAFLGRGKGDISASHDLEDMLLLFFGREELVGEILRGEPDIVEFVAGELRELLAAPEFEWLVQSTVRGDAPSEQYLFERLEKVAG